MDINVAMRYGPLLRDCVEAKVFLTRERRGLRLHDWQNSNVARLNRVVDYLTIVPIEVSALPRHPLRSNVILSCRIKQCVTLVHPLAQNSCVSRSHIVTVKPVSVVNPININRKSSPG